MVDGQDGQLVVHLADLVLKLVLVPILLLLVDEHLVDEHRHNDVITEPVP
jgi:hypothetical protein